MALLHGLTDLCGQERERKERERVVRAKVAASAFARGYLNGIVKSVFQQLQDTGYFYDPVEREVRGLAEGLRGLSTARASGGLRTCSLTKTGGFWLAAMLLS